MPDLSPYTTNSNAVWVEWPSGGLFAYRTDLIYSVARLWAEQWNSDVPSDVPPGSKFHHVASTTTFKVI